MFCQLVEAGVVVGVLTVEPFMLGDFVKLTNNTGKKDSRFPATEYGIAFGHFTYLFSRGQEVVVDLQAELINNMDKKATWDRFYTENNSSSSSGGKFKNFEWFFGFAAVQDFIMPHLQPQPGNTPPLRVLDMGCGTSALGPSIYRHAPLPVAVSCADISPVAVRLMRQHVLDGEGSVTPRHPLSTLAFLELDCSRDLLAHFGPGGGLDLIVDKGTTDALLRSRDGGGGGGKASLVVRQCLKVLRGSGCLLQFSDEDPDARVPWLETGCREPAAAGAPGVPGVAVQEVGELRGVRYYCYRVTPPPPPPAG